jgi:hypothetical protein
MNERLEIDPDEVREPESPAPRRQGLTALFLVLAVGGVGYLSWWTYQTAKPPKIPTTVPVIHSDAGPVKEAPKNPGGMIVPDQDSALLNRDSKNNPKVEQLLPEPEPVLPRPAAAPKPAPPSDMTAAPPKPEPPRELAAAPASAPSQPVVTQATAPAVLPSTTNTVSGAPAAPAIAPSPAIAAVPPASNAPRSGSGGSYRLQLGAVRSEDAAKQEWQRLQKAEPSVLGKLSLMVERANLGDKGIFYRIQAGPIADAAEAAQDCAALKNRNVGCILVKP